MKLKLQISRGSICSMLSVLTAMIIGAFIIMGSGENPFVVYYHMMIQPLSSLKNILNVLYVMTPLIMTGLAFIVASSAGMVNLGLEGQLLLGAMAAAYVATLFPVLPWFVYIPLLMTCAMVAGALCAFLPGYLKLRFGASEIVTCIMLNYIAQFLTNLIIGGGHFKHESIAQRTPHILTNAHFTSLSEFGMAYGSTFMRGVQLNGMFIMAMLYVLMVYILLKKTKWGYQMSAVGINIKATNANRLNSKKIMLSAMVLSGAIAGVSAMGEVLGTFNGVVEGFSPGYGFSGISVALLGRSHPTGIIWGALFFGVMNQGMMYINANTAVPKDFVKVLQTLIIVFIVVSPYLEEKWEKLSTRRKAMREGA